MEDFAIFVVVVVVLVFAIIGVVGVATPEEIYPQYHHTASNVCIKNGGVRMIEIDKFHSDVYCKDGATFPDAIQMVGEEGQK